MIPMWVSPVENHLWFRRKVIARGGSAVGVNKNTPDSVEKEETWRLSSLQVLWMDACVHDWTPQV